MATIEFNPFSGEKPEPDEGNSGEKGKVVPLGTGATSPETGAVVDVFVYKINEFVKLKPEINSETYALYKEQLQERTFDDLMQIVIEMPFEEMKSHPSYTKALFDLISEKRQK